jgi:GNAT superfamily N-acetyltransferase
MEIRLLTGTDGNAYRYLRLRALQEHPEAFGASFEEEEHLTSEQFAQQLQEGPPNTLYFGAFLENRLVGMLLLQRYIRSKVRHKAMLSGMYVVPEARGQQIGRALLAAVLAHARTLEGLEDLTLAVTVGNDAARQLYLAAGFTPYGIEPHYIRVAETYFAIEWMHLSLSV